MSDSSELPPTLDIALDPPLEVKGGRYDVLRLREPKTIEVRQAESHMRTSVNVETMRRYQIALVAKVADVPEPVVELMPISVLNRAVAYLMGFIEPGQGTGKS